MPITYLRRHTVDLLVLIFRNERMRVRGHLKRDSTLLLCQLYPAVSRSIAHRLRLIVPYTPSFSFRLALCVPEHFTSFRLSFSKTAMKSADPPLRRQNWSSPDSFVALSYSVSHFRPAGRNDKHRYILRRSTRRSGGDIDSSKLAVLRG